jgi:ATP-dependent Zn protease
MSQQQPPFVDYASPAPVRRRGWRITAIVVGAVLLLVLVMALLSAPSPGTPAISLSGFYDALAEGELAHVVVGSHSLTGRASRPLTIDGKQVVVFHVALPARAGDNWQFNQWLLENANGATIEADNEQDLVLQILVPLIPWVLIFAFVWFFVFRRIRRIPRAQPVPVYMVDAPDPNAAASPTPSSTRSPS